MRLRAKVLFVTLALLGCPLASGHIRPSVDENNRYLKLQLMGDRIRLVYIVYLGEVPGARARRLLDHDRDGAIDEEEASSYGKKISEEVAGTLEIEIDGAAAPLRWHQIDVGLGTPTTQAGSFSIDLVAWLCLSPDATRHTMVIHDDFQLPAIGESEIYVEESPGVTVRRASLGPNGRHSQLRFQWRGNQEYLSKLGLHLELEVDPAIATFTSDQLCGKETPTTASERSWWPLAAGLGALMLLGIGWWARRRRGR